MYRNTQVKHKQWVIQVANCGASRVSNELPLRPNWATYWDPWALDSRGGGGLIPPQWHNKQHWFTAS